MSSAPSTSSCRRQIDASFLAHLGPIADVIPIPLPFIRNVASIGDVVISIGLGFFLFATVLRTPGPGDRRGPGRCRQPPRSRSPVSPASARLHGVRPAGTGVAGRHPAGDRAHRRPGRGLDPRPADHARRSPGGSVGRDRRSARDGRRRDARSGRAIARPAPGVAQRIRRHPYVRLALDPSFSALWTSGLISLFGDRVTQIALAVVVYGITRSAVAVGFVFLAATLPNLLLGPLSGTLVDRWDQKQVLVVSDLLRAATVILDPDRGGHEPRARLPARLPCHLDLDLLPTGPGGGDAADRPRRTTC